MSDSAASNRFFAIGATLLSMVITALLLLSNPASAHTGSHLCGHSSPIHTGLYSDYFQRHWSDSGSNRHYHVWQHKPVLDPTGGVGTYETTSRCREV